MVRDAYIASSISALVLLLGLLTVAGPPLAFLPFAFLYLIAFAAQGVILYTGRHWFRISLGVLCLVAVLAACGLMLVALAWLSGNSFRYLLAGFFGKGGLGWSFSPYVVANLLAYQLFITRKRERVPGG